jgi:hypothetical protein
VQAETGTPQRTGSAQESPPVVRGPFEPLVEAGGERPRPDSAVTERSLTGPMARLWADRPDDEGTARGSAGDVDVAPAGQSEPEAADREFPGLADDGPAGSADAALERLRALHLTAASVEPQSLDAHFDQLLARQRKLISEYLGQADGPPSAPVAVATGDDDGSLVGLGDDYQTAR